MTIFSHAVMHSTTVLLITHRAEYQDSCSSISGWRNCPPEHAPEKNKFHL